MNSTGIRSWAAGALGLLLVAGTIGCGKGGGDKILIGHYGSMTGSEATFGQSTDKGIRLAVEEINAAGGINGKNLDVITYDDKGDANEAGRAVTRLVTRDGVKAVLGEVASKLSLAGAPVCQEYSVPMITPSSTNAKVTKEGTMISRVCFIDEFQGLVCAKFSYEHEKVKARKAAILYDQQSPYSKGLADVYEEAFTKLGGEIVSRQTYNAGDQDFTAQLTAIRSESPEAIFVPGYYTDVGNIALQTRRLGIKAPLIGGDGWDSTKLAEIGKDAINGSFYSNHYSHEDPNPRVQEFISKYKAKHQGAVPDGLAALGYDAAYCLAEAMKRSTSLDGKDLAAAIAATKDFDGVTGKITLDADRNAVKSAVILEMVAGKPKFLTTIAPE